MIVKKKTIYTITAYYHLGHTPPVPAGDPGQGLRTVLPSLTSLGASGGSRPYPPTFILLRNTAGDLPFLPMDNSRASFP